MNIIVTKHAIDQYRRKMFSPLGNDEIRKILQIAAERGSFVCKRPGDAYSLKYNGISIVVTKENRILTVITCLGNKQYSQWSKQNDIRPRYQKAAAI